MPKGTIDRTGEIVITFNPSTGDALVIAGRRVLPCGTCGRILDFDINGPCVAAAWCDVCSVAPRVDEDGVCASCEEMPTGNDGRSEFCAFHRSRPIIPTNAAWTGQTGGFIARAVDGRGFSGESQ